MIMRTGAWGAHVASPRRAGYAVGSVRLVSDQSDCLFCRIVTRDVPATLLHDSERVVAFRDIDPQAPTHVLVIPRAHHPDAAAVAAADPATLAEMIRVGDELARADGHGDYRLVFNTGTDAGQSVFHVHGHVLAGRHLRWPPG